MRDNQRQTIMLVDDDKVILTMGKSVLSSYYNVFALPSADKLFGFLRHVRPDIILLDIDMPFMDGFETISRLKADKQYADIPVVFLTANHDVSSELRGFDLGAVDYVTKPFSPPRLLKRIENQLLIKEQKAVIQRHAANLTMMVQEQTKEIYALQNAVISTVADLVEFRDEHTGGHITRTQLYMSALLNESIKKGIYKDEIGAWNMNFILPSAQLHDVGKISISDLILNKPGKLTDSEFEIMKTHVQAGTDAIKRILDKTSDHAFLRHALHIAGAHHEKWNGSGYPNKLKGKDIPLEGRLMAIVDVYDALVAWRPYKKPFKHEDAAEIIKTNSGTHFDPALIEVFRSAEDEISAITKRHITELIQ